VEGFETEPKMSNFDRTPAARERTKGSGSGSGHEVAMPNTDDFWQYAEEALLSALSAKSNDDRKNLLELAQTWTRAALLERRPPDKPTTA
jgi:hypothetical protein